MEWDFFFTVSLIYSLYISVLWCVNADGTAQSYVTGLMSERRGAGVGVVN